jgi:hypothetical protein
MNDFQTLLGGLRAEDVSFVIVGGVAATLHGSARLTTDLDIVYERSPENCARLARALDPLDPYLRGTPPGLPFRLTTERILGGLNFTLRTNAGDIDLLGELAGIGPFQAVYDHALPVDLFGSTHRVINLEALIKSKRAAGRPRDFEVIAELQIIADERRSNPPC